MQYCRLGNRGPNNILPKCKRPQIENEDCDRNLQTCKVPFKAMHCDSSMRTSEDNKIETTFKYVGLCMLCDVLGRRTVKTSAFCKKK